LVFASCGGAGDSTQKRSDSDLSTNTPSARISLQRDPDLFTSLLSVVFHGFNGSSRSIAFSGRPSRAFRVAELPRAIVPLPFRIVGLWHRWNFCHFAP